MTIKAINVRNQFKGTVKEIIEGPVLSEIDADRRRDRHFGDHHAFGEGTGAGHR